MQDKVTTIVELLELSFQTKDEDIAVEFFRNAYQLNRAVAAKDKELTTVQSVKAFLKIYSQQPKMMNFTDEERKHLYPEVKTNTPVNLEVLSPANVAIKQLKRELSIK